MKISILTATYNRAKYLTKLYESILQNIGENYEIEWLIMDDGSSDNTENLINKFINDKKIQIKYYKQENQGKMKAINNLMKYVTGELTIECDSDDYFINNAFKSIQNNYEYNKNQNNIYAYAYLKYDKNKHNIGNHLKNDKTKMFDLYFKEGECGEKALVFITDIRKKYNHKLENNEKFITEARLYHEMDKNYNILCFNEPLMICEYHEEGYTKNINKQFINNPYGYYKYFYEILNDMDTRGILLKKRIYAIKHFILFSFLTKQQCWIEKGNIIDKILIILLYIPGIIKSKKYEKKNLNI